MALHWHTDTFENALPRAETGLRQITMLEQHFLLPSILSVTDQNTFHAARELRTTHRFESFPASLEWVVRFGPGTFHLGIHNLPPNSLDTWERHLTSVAQYGGEGAFQELLSELHRIRTCLVVLNHPFWDLARLGREKHKWLLCQFLHRYRGHIHALEFNGKRVGRENQKTKDLAEQYGLPVVSGADVHGLGEPNVVNLTTGETFAEFVAEIRMDGISNIYSVCA